MKSLMERKVEEHEATIDYNEPRDFIDKYLIEIRDTTDPSSSFYGARGRVNLAATLLDLFLAGSETTSTTLTWAMLYMAREPAVQDRVQVILICCLRSSLFIISNRFERHVHFQPSGFFSISLSDKAFVHVLK
jgi:Cytochrome P450